MLPYSYYFLKLFSCLIITQLDSYFKYLLTEALSLCDMFSYSDAFL